MRTEAQLVEAIESIHARAKPFRDQREAVNLQIEELKTKARALSSQILEIEDEAIPLDVELQVVRKRAGRLIKPKPL
jgi:predicted  nucleic acid-binding Zn-ribbon protein